MATTELSNHDLQFITESLKYTSKNFEKYQQYPSQDFKRRRLDEAADVLARVSKILSEKVASGRISS